MQMHEMLSTVVSNSLLIQKINLQFCSDLAVHCAVSKWIVSNLKSADCNVHVTYIFFVC